MDIKLPRILSPNLGCPIIVSPTGPQDGIDVVIAEPADAARSIFSLAAKPSFLGEGQEFNLILEAPQELTDSGLPPAFDRVEQTRWNISTTLKTSIFAGKARFRRFSAIPATELTDGQLRTISGQSRITLYDLVLGLNGEELGTVYHALALRPAGDALRFIHATDLHVALRNDIYEAALQLKEDGSGSSATKFVNFNKNLRLFIEHANDLADQGKLDFVLLLGDLVDFIQHNYGDREDYGENNWRLLCDILLGAEARGFQAVKKPGIKVPVFTSTGNHDWRFFPYTPGVCASAYGLDKKSVKALNPFWADDPEELVKKTKQFYQKMLDEGALLSNVMLGGRYLHKVGDWLGNLPGGRLLYKVGDWLGNLRDRFIEPHKVRGNLLDWLLPRMATWQMQVLAPLVGSLVAAGAKPSFLSRLASSPAELLSIVIVAISGLMNGVIGFMKFLVRWKSPDLMALEAGREGLRDYFLNLNPYFNYAFQVERNYFLILDTGFDCLRAQRFWDNGLKKIGRIGIKDNILGGSPDSMSFFEANEFYPYSQIAWLEGLLRLISDREGKVDGPARIFIGVHAPPINLSEKQRRNANAARQGDKEIILKARKYNIRYGTINHYLSQFLHLCLGRAEGRPEEGFRQVTIVFAGHAHWRLECRLHWDEQKQKPLIYYGDYTGVASAGGDKPWPLILQTPAIGPIGIDEFSKSPPHFRLVEVAKNGKVLDAGVKSTNP